MTTNRLGFESQIASLPAEHQQVWRSAWKAITDLQTAIPYLKSSISANTSSITNVSETVSSSSETVVSSGSSSSSSDGTVNNQTGVTSYTTQTSDSGDLIVFDDASAVAVTLSASGTISTPWYATFLNLGAGAVTLTPASGTISYASNLSASSMVIAQGNAASVFYDGVNFWAELVNASGGNAGTITGVTAGTGLSGGGTSGDVTLSIATTGVTAGSYTNTNLTVNAEGLVTSAANGSSGGSPVKQTITIGTGTLAAQTEMTLSTTVSGQSSTSVVVAYIVGPTASQPFYIEITPFWNTTTGTMSIELFNSSTSLSWTYTGASIQLAVWV
jgi:hypothetical protein